MEYTIVISTADSIGVAATELENRVNELIVFGWKPQGGVRVENTGNYHRCIQAMIKED